MANRNERLTSKERMYEVYLNIVEWGPLVYGIQEASAYYFNKRPSQLNTEESISWLPLSRSPSISAALLLKADS